MKGPIARIAARYLAAALVTYGAVTPDVGDSIATDPDVIALVGAALGIAVEGVYAFAKRRGWTT